MYLKAEILAVLKVLSKECTPPTLKKRVHDRYGLSSDSFFQYNEEMWWIKQSRPVLELQITMIAPPVRS